MRYGAGIRRRTDRRAILFILFAQLPPIVIDAGIRLAVAGVLVGVGTRLGSGCQRSRRLRIIAGIASLVATFVFMAAGFATVFVMRRVISS